MLLDLLKARASCRRYQSKPIAPEIIDYMLECARLSPAGGNKQPWKFGVVTDRERIRLLAGAASVNFNQSWVETAPLVIALCTELHDEPRGSIQLNRFSAQREKVAALDRDLYAILEMEEHQTKIPGEHMVLAALEYGIQSCWISSLDCERAGEILGLEGYLVSNLITFGYPETERPATPKKSLEEIAFKDHFSLN